MKLHCASDGVQYHKGSRACLVHLKDLSRKLWPVTWVDITFHVKPSENAAGSLKSQRGVIQVSAEGEALSVQVENEDVIPEVVRHLVKNDASILKVNPRDYTLEDIYFALQAGES